jgi:hypothetical protein
VPGRRANLSFVDLPPTNRSKEEEPMSWKRTIFVAGAVAVATGSITGCGAIYKTRPQDMNVRGHEQAAVTEDAPAKESEADALTVGRGSDYARVQVQHHVRLADAHRAAAVALREDEEKQCAGVPAEAATRADIAGAKIRAVEPIEDSVRIPHVGRSYYTTNLNRARLTVDGDVTPGAVERLLGCRIAHAAAVGDDGKDPVGVAGASARVHAAEGRLLTVELRASDRTAAAELLRRAQALAAR